MGKNILLTVTFLLCGLQAAIALPKVEPGFTFKEGDRVVFLGGTTLERAQKFGYIETLLTTSHQDKDLTFRNLAWSGDTVWGDSRAAFDTAKEGFERMVKHVHDANPTVIFLQTGQNESFAGEAGLENYLKGLDRLLKALEDIEARYVFLSPTLHEDLGAPWPDPTERNQAIQMYAEAIHALCTERGDHYIDLTKPMHFATSDPVAPLTDNSLHFTAYGYWKLAQRIVQGLGDNVPAFLANADSEFAAQQPVFFTCPIPDDAPEIAKAEEIYHGLLSPSLEDGGQIATGETPLSAEPIANAPGYYRVKGLPEAEQAEKLREAIIEKNRLFFNRWRPQNETYIYGFRKHEQGRYSEEIPQYDPLIEAQEQLIRELAVPLNSMITLKKEGGAQ